jgi:hypothetical protein
MKKMWVSDRPGQALEKMPIAGEKIVDLSVKTVQILLKIAKCTRNAHFWIFSGGCID